MTVDQFKKELKNRLAEKEVQLRTNDSVSVTRYKYAQQTLIDVQCMIDQIGKDPKRSVESLFPVLISQIRESIYLKDLERAVSTLNKFENLIK